MRQTLSVSAAAGTFTRFHPLAGTTRISSRRPCPCRPICIYQRTIESKERFSSSARRSVASLIRSATLHRSSPGWHLSWGASAPVYLCVWAWRPRQTCVFGWPGKPVTLINVRLLLSSVHDLVGISLSAVPIRVDCYYSVPLLRYRHK